MRVEPAGGNIFNVLMDITGVTQADGGSYKVVAKNKLGEVSASINLNFNRKYSFTKVIYSRTSMARTLMARLP